MNLHQYSSVSNAPTCLMISDRIARWAGAISSAKFNIHIKNAILLLDLNTPFCTERLFYLLREMKNIRALNVACSQ